MGLKDIVNKIKQEVKVVQGEETKDKVFTNENVFPDEATAEKEFERAKQKLFDVNNWSNIEGLTSTFELYDERGHKTTAIPRVGYYINIILPASQIENWVQISEVNTDKEVAEFVVHPSEKPRQLTEEEVVEHFFIKEASSTFRVSRHGARLVAYEIGKNEGINNQGEEAGDRAVLNTLISEGGWAGLQDLQWDNLTRYLVHLTELK
ncbi:hypothetical protein [Botryobacter ruber]|uniref:hypothetical protein n=1 Tax=Botryobacter ruber TaxID=2171629 RepID=UPI000E0B372C|nr:hypothetical protein [Botryobacter ruber]